MDEGRKMIYFHRNPEDVKITLNRPGTDLYSSFHGN